MTPAQVLTNDSFSIPSGRSGFRRALLLSPPVYDAQYWSRWSQPANLLRLGTLLKSKGYLVDLIDCMDSDEKGHVRKARRVVDGKQVVVHRDDISKPVYHFGLQWDEVRAKLAELDAPDEVWISSIMTYWWESTRDAVSVVRKMFPHAEVYVGGIYPTLAPEHAQHNLGADVIFQGELHEASNLWTDLSLYETKSPGYAILTTSRGCPWECHYCAARALNGGSSKVRGRDVEDVLAEIEHKMRVHGVRRFGFYEDNSLVLRGHLQAVLEGIIERGHKVKLYAPEGFETRFLTKELLSVMKLAGFEKVHLPFETLKWDTNVGWNRRHASTASFEQALDAAIAAGFRPRTEEINAFVLFGLPDEKLEDILDSVAYVHHMVGSIIPMLFTPVPGTHIYNQHRDYLHHKMGWDLQHLNGKFLPFLEYNQQRYPELHASDYLQLEALMSVLNNGKFLSRAVNLFGDGVASQGFQSAIHTALQGDPDRQLVRS